MSPSASTTADTPGSRSSARSASQPLATPSRSKRSPIGRSTIAPRPCRNSDQRRDAGRAGPSLAAPARSPVSASSLASSSPMSTTPSLIASAPRPQSRTAVRVGPMSTVAAGAAFRRDRSDASLNRVNRPAHVPIRRRTCRAACEAASGVMPATGRMWTLTRPPMRSAQEDAQSAAGSSSIGRKAAVDVMACPIVGSSSRSPPGASASEPPRRAPGRRRLARLELHVPGDMLDRRRCARCDGDGRPGGRAGRGWRDEPRQQPGRDRAQGSEADEAGHESHRVRIGSRSRFGSWRASGTGRGRSRGGRGAGASECRGGGRSWPNELLQISFGHQSSLPSRSRSSPSPDPGAGRTLWIVTVAGFSGAAR